MLNSVKKNIIEVFFRGSIRSSKGRTSSLSIDEREFLPDLLSIQENPPSPLARWVLWTSSAFVAMLITWSCISSVDIYATAPGKFVPQGRVKAIQAADSASIMSLYIKEGQKVIEGELVAELDPVVNKAEVKGIKEKQAILKLEISRLTAELKNERMVSDEDDVPNTQIVLQEALKAAREANHRAKVSEARNNLQSKTMALTVAEDNFRKLDLLVRTTREREEKIRPYIGTVMPRFDYLRLKDDLTQSESQLISQQSVVKDAAEQKHAASQRISQLDEERVANILGEISEKNRSLIGLNADGIKFEKLLEQRQLRSPVDGVVQTIPFNTPGAVVGAGQTIATIVPSGAPLIVEGSVSNEDIGYVKVGQEVRLKIDTFPSQIYGSLPGRVIEISADAEERSVSASESAEQARGTSNLATKAGLYYKIKIKPNSLYLRKENESYAVTAGMTLQADIKTDRRKLISFFVAPLMKTVERSVKDR